MDSSEDKPFVSDETDNNVMIRAIDGSDGEDRSEATFSFIVQEASKMNDTQLSPPCYVRGLPWKIMIIPTNPNHSGKALGFFLQCNAESQYSNWSCNAVAELRLLTHKHDQEPHKRKIKHLFNSKENDWGFSYFLPWNELADPEKGFLKNDSLVFEVHVIAEAPHGVLWDSKKHTGYVGLKNQGATCYMNSLLQTLFFTNQLRKSVYKMPTEYDDTSKSVALALQRVFYELQFSNSPVGTKKLTKSFGWDTIDSFMQHDVQEFLRVLLDKLECKMKDTSLEGTVPKLFEGQMLSYIKCKNIEMTSKRTETFYDIQLSVKGNKNIYESFRDYIATETLDGDNKYDAGAEYGLQDAEKGVIFLSFPPILHLHLMRFQYDPVTDCSVKFNDRFEFDEEIVLDHYLAEKEDTDAVYKLHAVLVHSGDNHNGHYVVYINPLLDAKWCKFDDDVVSCCAKSEAIEHNYGGSDDEISLNDKQNSNAYMLVYIRTSEIAKVLQEVVECDIPSELLEKLEEEKRIEMIRRDERSDPTIYFTVHVVLEECFETHSAAGYFDIDCVQFKIFKVKKTETVSAFMESMSNAFKTSSSKIRIWPIVQRRQTTRMLYFDSSPEMDTLLSNVIESSSHLPWTVFLELDGADSLNRIQRFDVKRNLLIFMKFFDRLQNRLSYIDFVQVFLGTKLADLIAIVKMKLNLANSVELNAYEEIGHNTIIKLSNENESIEHHLNITSSEIQGYILIFEKKMADEKLELPTCGDYLMDLLYKVEVTFIDKSNPSDNGFQLELSLRNTYDQMAYAVGKKIDVDPNNIQFFKCQSYKDLPGNPLSSTYDGNLKDLLAYNKPKNGKKLFYQKILIDIHDLESKIPFKFILLSPDLREEKEYVLYVDKNNTIRNLLEEASKQIEFCEHSTRKLRLVEVSNHKLLPIPSVDTFLENLQINNEKIHQSHHKIYRIEEIPEDELEMNDDEMLIPVAHFWKEVYNSFGTPFFIKAKDGELYGDLITRIQKRLNIPYKEWEKFKFVLITHSKADYLASNSIVRLSDYTIDGNQMDAPLPYLGLEHINKSQKRPHNSSIEKSIKIYN